MSTYFCGDTHTLDLHFLQSVLLHATLFALLLLVAVEGSRAQPAGFVLGYEFGAPLDISREPGSTNPLGLSLTGSSQSHTLWLGPAYNISLLDDVSLRGSLLYGFAMGSFISDPYLNSTDIASGTAVQKEFTARSTSHLLSPNVQVNWQPGDNWRSSLGVWTTLNIASNLKLSEHILAPGFDAFESTSRFERELQPGTSQDPAFRFGPLISTSWKLKAGSNIEIRPEVFTKLDLTSAADLGQRAFSVGLKVNVAISSDLPPTEPDTIEPVTPLLTASVRIASNGVSLDTVTTRQELVFHRSFESIVPFLGYGEEINGRMLEVLGDRLADDRSLTIRIQPSGGGADQARKAFEAVRTRLKSFDVVDAQIEYIEKPVALGSEGLLITSSNAAVLRPMVDQWIDNRHVLPPITIERYVESERGLIEWRVEVVQNDRVLAAYTDKAGSASELESGLAIGASDSNVAIPPLVASLSVIDRSGQAKVATDSLIVKRGTCSNCPPDSSLYTYSLPVSKDPNDALGHFISSSNQLLIENIVGQVNRSSAITIRYDRGQASAAQQLLTELLSRIPFDPKETRLAVKEVTMGSLQVLISE